MKSLLPIVALVASLSACGGSDDNTPPPLPAATQAAVDATVHQQMSSQNLPGVVVLISIPGQGEMVKAYGEANLQAHAPRNTADPFRIASITKTFIGTLILQLADDGSLALSDSVSKWYPGFPNGDSVTVDLLLRMRSGFADSLDEDFLQEFYADPTAALTPQQMIDRAAARGAEFVAPDTVTRYNNLNYAMLGEIAEKVSGKDIRTLLEQRIYRPLGITHTVYPVATEFGGSNRGYLYNPGSAQFEDLTVLDPSPAGGAGAIISTLADLKPYARALCTGTLLKPATQALRLQGTTLDGEPAFVQYARGLLHLGNFCGHNGTIFGFSSEMFYLPAKDAVIVINVNRLDLDDHSQSTELLLLLTRQLFPQDVSW
jgi:D-alanyl-D-alanine carboxypeptidase